MIWTGCSDKQEKRSVQWDRVICSDLMWSMSFICSREKVCSQVTCCVLSHTVVNDSLIQTFLNLVYIVDKVCLCIMFKWNLTTSTIFSISVCLNRFWDANKRTHYVPLSCLSVCLPCNLFGRKPQVTIYMNRRLGEAWRKEHFFKFYLPALRPKWGCEIPINGITICTFSKMLQGLNTLSYTAETIRNVTQS